MSERARRYNTGKLRYEILSKHAVREWARVATLGAHKYSIYRDKDGNPILGKDIPFEEAGKYDLIDDASYNWAKGMSWTAAIGSVKRHIEAWEQGEDIDELGTLHLSNAMWGLGTLIDFYHSYPQGDDRRHGYLFMPKIGLDIDEVIADWVGHWAARHSTPIPTAWNFDRHIKKKFEQLRDDKDFWLTIPPKINPKDIPFEPHCYITSRSIPQEWTEEWLDANNFPAMPVYSVPFNESKVYVARESGVDIFVDDRFENFVELNKAGICCYLFDAPHNKRYDVGYKRIYSLKELVR